MKRSLKIWCIILALLIVASVSFAGAGAESSGEKTATLLFTHDMHAHFLPAKVSTAGGVIAEMGGYARLASAIKAEKAADPDALLLDAGDYSMGTLFQSIYKSDAPDLRIMGKLGYDAVTLGNHEFDFRGNGFADDLNAAVKSGDKLPVIVASNYTFPTDAAGELTDSLKTMKAAMENYGVKEYQIINRNGLKIGVFGLMGVDAQDKAPKSEIAFSDIVGNAKRVTAILKGQEKVDLVVVLSHTGTGKDPKTSEDELLAKAVPDIDVIISGHTHTTLEQSIAIGSTLIVSSGENAEKLGVLKLKQRGDGRWEQTDYGMKLIDKTLAEDAAIKADVDAYRKTVETKFLSMYGLTYDQVLAYTNFNFTEAALLGKTHDELPLGDLITDSYIYTVKKAEGANYEPVDVAVTAVGTIRGTFTKGNITVADVFNVSSLGVGADGISGYPLVSVYLTGKELKTVAEVDASISPIMSDAQLYTTGLTFKFNPNRLIFNKVTEVSLQTPDDTVIALDDDKLYRVVTGLYLGQMLSVVGDKSFGLLTIVPKDKNGAPITDFDKAIIKEAAPGGGEREVKEWVALASYLSAFDKASNGVAQVPVYYSTAHGRKIVDQSRNIGALLYKPNTIALVVYAIVLLLLTLVIFIIYRIATRKRRKARKLARKSSREAAIPPKAE